MLHTHTENAWFRMSLAEQMGNIGSEVGRAARARKKHTERFWPAVERALELFSFTIADARWHGRAREIARTREVFADAVLGGEEYGSSLSDIEQYCMRFALLARFRQGK